MAKNLALAESAWAEADALRKSTLALTQNLSMDVVLDTLLESLFDLVPYDSASVILMEADGRLLVAREAPQPAKEATIPILDAKDNVFIERVLLTQKSVLVADTTEEPDWKEIKALPRLRSWMCVPLVASEQVLGLLSVGHCGAKAFTPEHLRKAKSLAVAAAAAIQNARLYERAEFYSAALEVRLKEVRETQN
jgi:GAF domain-containing protein